jgi:hypothetical protein
MQCNALTSKNKQCKNNGKWFHWPLVMRSDQFAGFYSCLCTSHTRIAKEDLAIALYVPPRPNMDAFVAMADYVDAKRTQAKEVKQEIATKVENSPMAQAMINHELPPNTRRLASGTIVELTPQGKAMRAVLVRKPSQGTPKIVEQHKKRKLASGKWIIVDRSGRMVGYASE